MTLESLDFHAQTNRAFEDVEEAMSREIDVSAIQRVHHDPEQEAAVLHGGACARRRGFPNYATTTCDISSSRNCVRQESPKE